MRTRVPKTSGGSSRRIAKAASAAAPLPMRAPAGTQMPKERTRPDRGPPVNTRDYGKPGQVSFGDTGGVLSDPIEGIDGFSKFGPTGGDD